MNKEEILKKSRADNKEGDEREKGIRMSSAVPAFIALGVSGLGLMIAEWIFLETEILTQSISFLFVTVVCVQNWYLTITLKKKFYFFTALFSTITLIFDILILIDVFRGMM